MRVVFIIVGIVAAMVFFLMALYMWVGMALQDGPEFKGAFIPWIGGFAAAGLLACAAVYQLMKGV